MCCTTSADLYSHLLIEGDYRFTSKWPCLSKLLPCSEVRSRLMRFKPLTTFVLLEKAAYAWAWVVHVKASCETALHRLCCKVCGMATHWNVFGSDMFSPHTYSIASGSVASVPFWLFWMHSTNSDRLSGLTQSFTLRQNLVPPRPLVTALARQAGAVIRAAGRTATNPPC